MNLHMRLLALLATMLAGTFTYSSKAGASTLTEALNAMPPNSWQKINSNQFSSVWTPLAQRPTTASPASNISAWSGAAWDARRKQIYIWGGDIGNEQGNEVYIFNAQTGLWSRGALPSAITSVNGVAQTVDGYMNTPVSGESWDNLVYLPNVDRLALIGVSREGLTFQKPTGEPTGPYFWDPDRADPNKASGVTGSHVNPSAFPEVIGGEMWLNRDNFPSDKYRAQSGVTGYFDDQGRDVVFWAGYYDSFWRYTVVDQNPANDVWQWLGRRTSLGKDGWGAGSFDASRGIFVKTLTSTSFGFWDVNHPNPSKNYEIEVYPAVPEGSPGDFRNLGLEYDPTLGSFLLWAGDSQVWILEPPVDLDPDGDGIKTRSTGWVLRPLNPSGVGPVLPSRFTGVYGKWMYLPEERAYLGVIDPNSGDVFVYRPPYNDEPPEIEIASLTLSTATTTGCRFVTGTVVLDVAAPAGGFEVRLSSDLPSATPPGSVLVPAGSVQTSFSIQTDPVTATQVGRITATGTSASLVQPLTVRPMGVETLALARSSVTGGSQVRGAASLECPAGPGPVTVLLSSSDPTAASPTQASVLVPAGQQSFDFNIGTSPVSADVVVTIAAMANDVGETVDLLLIPNNLPPTVALTAPLEGSSHVAGQPIGMAATAGDSNGTVARVEFYAGLTKLGEDTSAPYAYAWSNAPIGSHLLTAVAYDDEGASTTSAAVAIHVTEPIPNLPPSASLTAPADGTSFLLGQPITLAATATDPDNSVVRVEFYAGLVKLGEDSTAPYGYTWTTASAGSHLLTAVAFDSVGASASSAAVLVTVSEATGADITVTLQDGLNGYAGTRDAYLYEAQKSINFGARDTLMDQASGTKRFRSLLQFAIFASEGGPVPDGATIVSATLSLYKHSYYNYTYRLRPLLSSWVESEVNWNQSQLGVPWTTPGATAIGSDLALTHDTEAYTGWDPGWINFDLTGGIQAIRAGRPNYGWLLEGVKGNTNIKQFRSSEYLTDPALRPKLIVTYH
jgi:hypothetical protein